uniref:Uncharacterized protein n=1 Tax=Arundo donax TaxID=35708 RepID=A0A0A9BH59_ARUDO
MSSYFSVHSNLPLFIPPKINSPLFYQYLCN